MSAMKNRRSLIPRTVAEASDALGAIVAAELREDGWTVEDSLHPSMPTVIGPLQWRLEDVRYPDGRVVPVALRPRPELPPDAVARVLAIARKHGLCADAEGWGGLIEAVTVVDECCCGTCDHRADCTCLDCGARVEAGR